MRTLFFIGIVFFAHISIAQQKVLDDFEYDDLRISNPTGETIKNRLLWSQYEGDPTEGPDPGSVRIDPTDSVDGSRSLAVDVTGGNVYLQFYTKVNSTTWEWARHFVRDGNWSFDTYNRLRFWVKLPDGISRKSGGQSNTRFGTYYRATTGRMDSAESGGNHYYHYYNLESTGVWHQVIVDWHPNNIRGQSGGTDWGEKQYPTGEQGYNYFDLLTRFYFEINGGLSSYPAVFRFDGFEFYTEPNDENLEQVYALNGAFNNNTGTLYLGWMRHKDENNVDHEVRYAFSNIHELGWSNATPAPSGIVSPDGWGGYNAMDYTTNQINVGSNDFLYVAIKPQNSNRFRQITIPIDLSTSSGLPNPGDGSGSTSWGGFNRATVCSGAECTTTCYENSEVVACQ